MLNILIAIVIVFLIAGALQFYNMKKNPANVISEIPKDAGGKHKKKGEGKQTPKEKEEHKEELDSGSRRKSSHAQPAKTKSNKPANPTHPWYHNALKGFHGEITGFDYDEESNTFAASSKEKIVKIFRFSDKTFSDPNPKTFWHQVEYFLPTAISFTKKTLAIAIEEDNNIEIYNVNDNLASGSKEKLFEKVKAFPKHCHKSPIIALEVDKKAKSFLVSASGQKDLSIKVWSLNGDCLHSIATNAGDNYFLRFVNETSFLYLGAWTPDVKVYDIKRNKDNSFKLAGRPYQLTGHKQGITHIGVDNTNERAVTVSKDATVKSWIIEDGNTPREQETLQVKNTPLFQDGKLAPTAGAVASKKDKAVLALGFGNNLVFYEFPHFKVKEVIYDAHTEEATISDMQVINTSEATFLLTNGTDNRINIWKIPL